MLPQEVVEVILKHLDAPTFEACRSVSPLFAQAAKRVEQQTDFWRIKVRDEITSLHKMATLSILATHPHSEGKISYETFREVHRTWYYLKGFPNNQQPTAHKVKIRQRVRVVFIHGSEILVLMEFNENFGVNYKFLIFSSDLALKGASPPFDIHDMHMCCCKKGKAPDRVMVIPLEHCDLAIFGDTQKVIFEDKISSPFSIGSTTTECNHGTISNSPYPTRTSRAISVITEFGVALLPWNRVATVTSQTVYGPVLFMGTDTGTIYAYLLSRSGCADPPYPVWVSKAEESPTTAINCIKYLDGSEYFALLCSTKGHLYSYKFPKINPY